MTIKPRHHRLPCLSDKGFHHLHITEWGPQDAARVVICWHGLTRNGRDFDALAKALAATGARVICPDTIGRGQSDWARDAATYGYPQYLRDAAAVIGWSGAEKVDWVGTSMGGLIGMMLAAQPDTPIAKLVLNDVGPLIPGPALKRIGDYLGRDPSFETLDKLEQHLRVVHAPFGDLSDAEWQHLARHSARQLEDGSYKLAYDPAIAAPFKGAEIADVNLWPVWDAVRQPTLVLRGASSDLLLADTAHEMTTRGPKARLVEFKGCGHAPALMDTVQIRTISDYLTTPSADATPCP